MEAVVFILIVVAVLGFKLWLFLYHPDEYRRQQEKEERRKEMLWKAGSTVAGHFWNKYK